MTGETYLSNTTNWPMTIAAIATATLSVAEATRGARAAFELWVSHFETQGPKNDPCQGMVLG